MTGSWCIVQQRLRAEYRQHSQGFCLASQAAGDRSGFEEKTWVGRGWGFQQTGRAMGQHGGGWVRTAGPYTHTTCACDAGEGGGEGLKREDGSKEINKSITRRANAEMIHIRHTYRTPWSNLPYIINNRKDLGYSVQLYNSMTGKF